MDKVVTRAETLKVAERFTSQGMRDYMILYNFNMKIIDIETKKLEKLEESDKKYGLKQNELLKVKIL